MTPETERLIARVRNTDGPGLFTDEIVALADALEAVEAELHNAKGYALSLREDVTDLKAEVERLTGAAPKGKPAPDYNPRVNHPERYSDGPY